MRVPWSQVWNETLDNQSGDFSLSLRGFFELPAANIAATFLAFSEMPQPDFTFSISLIFGFDIPDASSTNINTQRIIFSLSAATPQVIRSFNFDRVPGPFGAIASAPGVLPPIVAVRVTNKHEATPIEWEYHVYVALIGW